MSHEPALSADGRFVAFQSEVENLVAGVTDENERYDVFLHDRVTLDIFLQGRTGDARIVSRQAGDL